MSEQQQDILERLERIEAMLAPMSESSRSLNELREDMVPLLSGTFPILIKELQEVETGFSLDDLFYVVKRSMRSIRQIAFVLEQLEMIVDLVQTMEPLLRSTVPQLINYLDDLEQAGVLKTLQASLAMRSKFASAYSADDVEEIGDGLISLFGLAKKLSTPEAQAFLEKMAGIPGEVNLDQAKSVGPLGMLTKMGAPEVRQGLGVMVELTKAMGKLKS